jgi:ABC-type nitrate/sulfonate/bicarbonate transport system substrate-binding protein
MQIKIVQVLSFALILTIFSTIIAACGASQPAKADKTAAATAEAKVTLPAKLRIGFISANNSKEITGPEGWAQRKGYLEEELKKYGVNEFKFSTFPNGPNLNEALSAGELDIGIYGDTPAISAKSAGIKTRVINQTQINMNVWLIAAPNGPKTLADLKGKKVATSQGSYMSRYISGLLKEQGLDKDVKVVHLLPSDGEAALVKGDIAAFAYPTGFGPLMLNKGYTLIDEAAKHKNLSGSSVTVVLESFLEKTPQFPKIWNDIRSKAVKEIQAKPDEYFKFYSEVSGYPIDVVKASFKIGQWPAEPFIPDGLTLLDEGKKYLVEAGLAKKDFVLNDWILKP